MVSIGWPVTVPNRLPLVKSASPVVSRETELLTVAPAFHSPIVADLAHIH
ncbi:MAG: hypothetical protein HY325_05045 [Chloroflexi bacterium]|nr:hypothetical protein [Chloroflexota bacterium]